MTLIEQKIALQRQNVHKIDLDSISQKSKSFIWQDLSPTDNITVSRTSIADNVPTVHDMRRLSVNPASPMKSSRMNSISVPSTYGTLRYASNGSGLNTSRVRFDMDDVPEEESNESQEGLQMRPSQTSE